MAPPVVSEVLDDGADPLRPGRFIHYHTGFIHALHEDKIKHYQLEIWWAFEYHFMSLCPSGIVAFRLEEIGCVVVTVHSACY